MNKQSKYFYLIKYVFLAVILNVVLGVIQRFITTLNSSYNIITTPLDDIISVSKVLLVIAIISGVVYLVYLVYMYYSSRFYKDYRIEVFEAIYHGFVDIHGVYDRVKRSSQAKNIQIDFKKSTITFNTKGEYYCIKYLDLFGKIEGKQDSEFWASVSKPRTKYNQKTYMKKIKFPNPYRSNLEYTRELKRKTNNEYKCFVVISGFYNMKYKSEFIISPYELIDFI